jgi:hypothetical protein
MNLIQQQELLKNLSDDQIAQEMQYPSGQMPLYLISSEAKRRADLRQRFKSEASGPPPQSTVQEDLMSGLTASQLGLGAQAQQPMAPGPGPQQGIMQGAPASQQPPGFADGGPVYPSLADSAIGRLLGLRQLTDPSARPKPTGQSGRGLIEDVVSAPASVVVDTSVYDSGDSDLEGPPEFLSRESDLSGPGDDTPFYLPTHPGAQFAMATDADIDAVSAPPPPGPMQGPPMPTALQRAQMEEAQFYEGLGSSIPKPGTANRVAAPNIAPLTLEAGPTWEATQKAKLAELEAEGDPFAAQAARLAEREAAAGANYDKDLGLALAEAGFGIAAGDSQHWMQNVGKGALPGIKSAVAAKRYRDAQEEKIFDANTALIKNRQDLKATRLAQADAYAKGLISDAERKQNIAIAERNAAVKDAEIKMQVERTNALLTSDEQSRAQSLWQSTKEMEARRLGAQSDRAAKAEEGALDRASLKERAEIAANALSSTGKDVERMMADPKFKEEYMSLLSAQTRAKGGTALSKAFSKAWENVLKPYTEGDAPSAQDIPMLRRQFIAQMADEVSGREAGAMFDLYLLRMGAGGAAPQPPTRGVPLTIKKVPQK